MPTGAEKQRKWRRQTGYARDKVYKRARSAAMVRLVLEHPARYRELYLEEKAKLDAE